MCLSVRIFPKPKIQFPHNAILATHAKDTSLTWMIKLLSLRLAGGDVHEVLSNEKGDAQLFSSVLFPRDFSIFPLGLFKEKVRPISGNVQKSQIFWPTTFLRVRWWMHFL